MKPSELRIGNYLQDAKGKLAPVEGLSKNKIKAYSGIVTEMPLKPIPLTEEWLLKLGFEWNKETKTYEHKDFYLWHVSKSINIDIQNWQVFNYVLKAVANRKIKYVHQLQNLYFALTGEELTINK